MFFFSSRRRHTSSKRDWSSDVCSSDLKEEGGDAAAIDRLLDEGITVDLGSSLWSAIRDAAVALTATPFAFNDENVTALREAGLDDLSIIDVINSSAFFNWANRLMLTLAEPNVPKRFRSTGFKHSVKVSKQPLARPHTPSDISGGQGWVLLVVSSVCGSK